MEVIWEDANVVENLNGTGAAAHVVVGKRVGDSLPSTKFQEPITK